MIELALEESNQHLQLTTYTESDDKLLARVASIYLILRRLGFTNDQVEACLRSVPNLELDDALDWVGRVQTRRPESAHAVLRRC